MLPPSVPSRLRLAALALALLPASAPAGEAIDLGSRRELFLDDSLVARREGVELCLHRPVPRETVFTFDARWEGTGSDFERLIRVGSVIRLYYIAGKSTVDNGLKLVTDDFSACMAESVDGIHWIRPDLGVVPFLGSRHNNIVYTAPKLDNFTPFLDTNPACPPDERFKAMSLSGAPGLHGLKSPDGIHWSPISEQPLITHGKFDTQNNAFWDPLRHQYWCYIRGFHGEHGEDVTSSGHGTTGIRDIRVATSPDFRHWTDPKKLAYVDSPDEALYTNQVEPYYRAPQIFVGFPTRYNDRHFSAALLREMPDPVHRQRRMSFVPRYGTVVTDGQFMFSRDGYTYRRWDEAFIPPGPERHGTWLYGDGYQSLGLIVTPSKDPTAPDELSWYADEGHWQEGGTLRRYTLRIDGFTSMHARLKPGELATKPLIFAGRRLSLNFSTSAAGSVRIELQSPDGSPLPGHALADCDELFGDTLARNVTWRDSADLSAFAGRPVVLRFVLSQADLYSLKFEN